MVRDTQDGGTLSLLDLIGKKGPGSKKWSNKPAKKPPLQALAGKATVADEAPSKRDIKKQKSNPRWSEPEKPEEKKVWFSEQGDTLEYYTSYIEFLRTCNRYFAMYPHERYHIEDDKGAAIYRKAMAFCNFLNGKVESDRPKPTKGDLEGAIRSLSVRMLSQKREG